MWRRFGNAFNWYNMLVDEADKHIDEVISIVRRKHCNVDKEISEPMNMVPPVTSPQSSPVLKTPSTKRRQESSPVPSSPPSEDSAEPKRVKGITNPFPDPVPRDRPTEYLRERCPLCFGGATEAKMQSG